MTTRHFATAKITGGPTGKNQKLEIDGVEQHGITGLYLSLDVSDVARLTVDRIVSVEVELTDGIMEEAFAMSLRLHTTTFVEGQGTTKILEEIATVKSDSISEGLADLAKQLKGAGR